MGNFKIGQKVVCIATFIPCNESSPKKGEEVVVEGTGIQEGLRTITLRGYLQHKGKSQVFEARGFKPLDEKDNFAKNLCTKLTKEFKKEQNKEYINN